MFRRNFRKIKKMYSSIPLRLVARYLHHIQDRAVDDIIDFSQGLDNTKLKLDADFRAYGMTAPVGFEFDGASSPTFAWWVIPRMYKMLKASCRHDWACLNARNWRERLLADIVFFLMAFYTEGLALWRCLFGLIGVRIGAYLGIGKNY